MHSPRGITRRVIVFTCMNRSSHRFVGDLGVPELPVALDASGDDGRDFNRPVLLAVQGFPSLVVRAYDRNLLWAGRKEKSEPTAHRGRDQWFLSGAMINKYDRDVLSTCSRSRPLFLAVACTSWIWSASPTLLFFLGLAGTSGDTGAYHTTGGVVCTGKSTTRHHCVPSPCEVRFRFLAY